MKTFSRLSASPMQGDSAAEKAAADEGLLLLRPLLKVARADIEAWLAERNQTFVTDSTNLDADAALRNTVRLRLLPMLEEMNPQVRQTLEQTMKRLTDAESLYEDAIRSHRASVESAGAIDISALQASTAPQTLLFEILHKHGFTTEQVREIYENLEGESGHVWQSPTCRLLRDRGRLIMQDNEQQGRSVREKTLPLEGLYMGADGLRLLIRRQAIDPATFAIPRDAQTACFDLEKLTLPLTIRTVAEGDRFQPFGMEGTRLVSDLLTDRKLSLFEKERQLVVCTPDAIAWVVGLRTAAGFEVDENTRHVMTLTLL